ncbi:MAG: FAD-dependent oxidoreductase [Chthoniobacteraceae bacterium]|nr:FAD-dependent oxidoreductase [Chthoniobacteraceae bacterium]
MLIQAPAPARSLHEVSLSADLAVIGGGAAGVCCAITAAREGLHVVLIHDRPVLGGNASSEVRLWLLGATCHMGSNNRWAREGGVINEIMMENLWRNPEGNPLIFDTVLLELADAEKNLTVLLNTSCSEVRKASPGRIESVSAYCSQNETLYRVSAPLFCDASGDGVVGFLSGAAFRMGAEPKEEFGEGFAPTGEFGALLGHSLYFYTKDTGRPVRFIAPAFALKDVENRIPRFRQFGTNQHGLALWWIEWGGRLDTVHATEEIKWELWRVVYGVWDYIKNSGKFPDAANLTLEWMGHIPGKRESRRFEGDYILTQHDIVERRAHPDDVAFGGWSVDLHPADGVYAAIAPSHHLHSKGVYPIPYRCYYSRNIENLFLAGRITSSSHVAFGSTRVMATCAVGAQAVAHAAVLCKQHGVLPRAVGAPEHIAVLQQRLLRTGNYIPGIRGADPADLARQARVSASSTLRLRELPGGGPALPLKKAIAQMLPLPAGALPVFTFRADVAKATRLDIELRVPSDPGHHTPDIVLERQTIPLEPGCNIPVRVEFASTLKHTGYVFVCFQAAQGISLHTSATRVTGLLRLHHNWREQRADRGGEDFDIFAPERRPGGQNLALQSEPPIAVFEAANVVNGWQRPTSQPNAWVAEPGADAPGLRLEWDAPRTISEIHLFFDGDFDHAMESVFMGHPERAVVFAVKRYEIVDDANRVIARQDNAHLSHAIHRLETPVRTQALTVRVLETWGAPAAIFEVRCYGGQTPAA